MDVVLRRQHTIDVKTKLTANGLFVFCGIVQGRRVTMLKYTKFVRNSVYHQ